MSQTTPDRLPRCGLARRFAAIAYDTLLLLAVIFVATMIVVIPLSQGGAHPGQAPTAIYAGHPFYRSLFATYIFFVAFFFFGWFWTHGGQTLGMRSWGIRVQTFDGHPISWWHALLRFMVAIGSWGVVGLGFLWALVDRKGLTWHDRYSETELVLLPKSARRR